METINIVLLLAGAFLVGFGVVAAFASAFFYAVRLVGRERQDKISRRDYFAAHAPEAPGWYLGPDNQAEGLFSQWPWYYADNIIRRGGPLT